MLYLTTPSQSDLDSYFDLIKIKLQQALSKSTLSSAIKKSLTEERLKKIITDKPEKLLAHHRQLMQQLVPRFSDKSYSDYLKIKGKGKKTKNQKKLTKKYKVVEQLSSIFDYDKIISKSKEISYSLAQKLNRNTCTYCNRIYSITIVNRDYNGRIIKNEAITRPQFDHWFAKSVFPVMALSFYNLIPSCSICNSTIKGDTEFSLKTHVHPYKRELGQEFRFTYGLNALNKLYVHLAITGAKMANTLKAFKIKEVYDGHSELELKDLYDLRHAYPDNYLETINRTFSSFKTTRVEAWRLIFGTEADEQNFHKRPFSKFKKDILSELGVYI